MDYDVAAAARLLVSLLDDPRQDPISLGYPLEMWMVLTGHSTDSESAGYDEGMSEAVALAYRLADPDPDPAPPPVVSVEVVRGEVL